MVTLLSVGANNPYSFTVQTHKNIATRIPPPETSYEGELSRCLKSRHGLSAIGTTVALSVAILSGCTKDLESRTAGPAHIAKHSYCVELVTLACDETVLVFDNYAHYFQVIACLEEEMAAHNDFVVQEYGYLTDDDDYNDMLNSIGWIDDQPLLDFESQLGFSSYRSVYADAELDWMNNDLDPGLDPDNWSCETDPVIQTLLGANGAMIIDGVLQFLDSDCNWWTIPSGDCSLIGNTSDPGVELTPKHHEGDCFWSYQNRGEDNYDNNRRQKWEHKLQENYTWGYATYRATQKYYKRHLGIVWLPYRVQQSVTGIHYKLDFDCHECNYWTEYREDRAKTLVVGGEHSDCWGFVECDLRARFTGPHGTIDDPSGC